MKFNPISRMTFPRMTRRYALTCGLLLWLGLAALQAEQRPEVTATLRVLIQRHIPAMTFTDGDEPPPEYLNSDAEYYYLTPQGYRPVQVEINNLSEAIQYQGPSRFFLYSRSPAISPESEDTYIPRMGCRLPTGQGADYFLVGLDESNSGMAKLHVLPIDPDRIPRGKVLAYNLGDVALNVATQEQRLELSPHQGALINVPGDEAMRFKIMAAIDENGDYKLVYRRNWSLRSQGRALCIFYPTNKEMTRWNSRLIPLN